MSYEAQQLTSEQKTQARTNIDAVSSAQLSAKLNGTVLKAGAATEGGGSEAIGLNSLTDEGEFIVPTAKDRPSGVSDTYQNLQVSVRRSGSVILQVIRGVDGDQGRVFMRTGTAAGGGTVTWVAWAEVGARQDLSGYANKKELQATDKKAQQGINDAKTANDAIAALGALAHKSQISPADLATDFDLGSIA